MKKAPIIEVTTSKPDMLTLYEFIKMQLYSQRDADHDFYTLPELETIEKIADFIEKMSGILIVGTTKEVKRGIRIGQATQLYRELFKEKKLDRRDQNKASPRY